MCEISNKLIIDAASLGACGKLKMGMSLESLIELLFSPQGREFCADHDFPRARHLAGANLGRLADCGIYVDAGCIRLERPGDYCLIGDTRADINISGVEKLFHIVVLDGAKAKVRASNYAVGSIEVSISGEYELDEDKTSIIRVIRQGYGRK